MLHVDLFAGIGGFSLGFDSAGAQTSAIVEWDEKCQELLGRRFPGVPIHGDIKTVGGAELGPVDILTGGFPCQDISIAGRRAGLAGERSGHFWEFARLIDETHPEWVVIENVRGLLSSGGRRDMGAVLGTLGDLGYGWAYRVLDAQFFGVPQRRQRVFIVGRAGADRDSAAEVLLEREGVRRNSAAGREAGQVVAGTLAARTGGGGFPGTDEAIAGYLQPVAFGFTNDSRGVHVENGTPPLTRSDTGSGRLMVAQPERRKEGDENIVAYVRSHTRNSMDDGDRWEERDTAVTLAAQPNIGIPGSTLMASQDPSRALTTKDRIDGESQTFIIRAPVGFDRSTSTVDARESVAPVMRSAGHTSGNASVAHEAGDGYAVRKLMPLECERLQGFPDDWTDGFPDTTRYRMLGNAVAVPVVEWLARRLVAVADQQREPRHGLTTSELAALNRLKGIA